ncbi:MAG: pyrroloquinoline quinone-dependent dehydrogenase [Proteobacteria bacterium]|nr:pyrroloquinoline quinone-dependent dehydrogenase [Pseudomonadota bacterium]
MISRRAAGRACGAPRGALALAALLLPALAGAQSRGVSDWGFYGGDGFGRRFSSLDQINRSNVATLKPVWQYRTGELGQGFARIDKLTFEATPVLAYGALYLETATNIVIALDPRTGTERWRYDPHVDRARRYSDVAARGVSLWEDPALPQGDVPCRRRVFTGTLDARLIALDADSGRPCAAFGTGGSVDLTIGIRIRDVGSYVITSPPAIYGNVVIVGSGIGDNRAVTLERGIIRGFDARSGALLWSFDPIPDGENHPAAADWNPAQAQLTGAGNAWGVMTVDEEHGLVLIPTTSPSPDFYGGLRAGSNRMADSLLVLDAATGRLVWSQQLVHHDLWDYDLAAQPVLGDIEVGGAPVPAVIQATKNGMLFVFERTRGRALYPIVEKPVPASHVPGETAAATQPFSTLPPLLPLGPVLPTDAWGVTFWDRGKCRDRIASLRNEGIFTPPDLGGTLETPGYAGGVDWGGIVFDEQRQRVITAVNRLPMVVTLLPRAEWARQADSGEYPHSDFSPQTGAPYGMRREPLLSPLGLPCIAPPWGTLVSVDLRRHRIAWQVPLGSTEGRTPWFVPDRTFGMPHMGGPIATAGDLVFVGAAMDSYLRAFDIETGRELWKWKLPAGGQATPMTYRAGPDQRQYVVISAGGHGPLGTPRGDYVIAFALPQKAAATH